MTVWTNDASGGTNGVTANTSNTGAPSGNAFSAKLLGPQNNTIVFDTSANLGKCYLLSQPTAGINGSGGWRWNGFTSSHFALRYALEWAPGSFPTTATTIGEAYQVYASARSGRIGVSGSGKLTLSDSAGTVIWTATNALPATGRIDVALVCVPGTTVSNGTLKAAYWTTTSGFAGAPAEESPNSGTSAYGAVNAGVGDITDASFGKLTSNLWQCSMRQTSYYIDTANTTDALPPAYTPPTNAAPTISPIASITGSAGVASTFTPSASDPDGTISSYAWTVTAYDGAPYTVTGGLTNSTLVITPGAHTAGARYDCTLVVTDNGGTSSAPVTGKLLVPGTVVRPILETSNVGGWTANGLTNNAVNRIAAVVDGLDTTSDQAPMAPGAPAETRQRVAPLVAGSAWNVNIDHRLSAAAPGVATIALYEGASQRVAWAIAGAEAPTTTKKTTNITNTNNTSGSFASIVSWLELDLVYIWGP